MVSNNDYERALIGDPFFENFARMYRMGNIERDLDQIEKIYTQQSEHMKRLEEMNEAMIVVLKAITKESSLSRCQILANEALAVVCQNG